MTRDTCSESHCRDAMDYSSLVAARPSVDNEPFSKSSSKTRRAAIVCAAMLLIACAALVATAVAEPVTPHRLILVDDNHVDHSLSLSMESAVGIPSHSDFHPTGTVLFTVLNTDPMDSVLKKAKLPTLTDIKSVMKCVEPLTKGMKTLASGPSASKMSSTFATLDKCAERLSDLADQCQSSPSLMALAMVPNVGSFVSFVCGQAAALAEKYEYYRTTL